MFYSIKYFGGGIGNSYYAQLLTFLNLISIRIVHILAPSCKIPYDSIIR